MPSVFRKTDWYLNKAGTWENPANERKIETKRIREVFIVQSFYIIIRGLMLGIFMYVRILIERCCYITEQCQINLDTSLTIIVKSIFG